MNGRNFIARVLVALGSSAWVAIALLHLKDYPKDTAKLVTLSGPLHAAFRTIFLMVGGDWIVIALVAMLAAFAETRWCQLLVLLCGLAGLGQAALALAFMGVFLGTELMFPAAILTLVGGLCLRGAVQTAPRAGP